MAKVLITGIDGFTGSHLSRYLRGKGLSVQGTSFFRNDPHNEAYKCDIRHVGEVRKIIAQTVPDYIIHLAGIAFVASENTEEMYSVNIQGSLNVLNACLDLKIFPNKIILASSASVYGNIMSTVLSEEMCPLPNSHYANSKLAMENMARTYFDKLKILIVRPFNYIGPGQAQHFVIPKIVEHYRLKKEEIELGNTHVFREFNDIRYVMALYFKALSCDNVSDIVNFCSGNAISLIEAIEILTMLTNHKIKINVNPEFVRKNEILSLTGSVEKLERMLGPPSKIIPLTDTLSRMLND
jgi:GDP-6-deoxy-D-talose 4-dehydrogenase